MILVGVGTYKKILRPTQYSTLAGMDPLFMENAHQLLGQIGHKCFCVHTPSLPEPMKGIVEGYGHPKVGVYDGGDFFPDHLHETNTPVSPLPLWEEDHGITCKLLWQEDLPEIS